MSKNGIIRPFLETQKKAFVFGPKHKCILSKTQVHLKQNAFAFRIKRKGVLLSV